MPDAFTIEFEYKNQRFNDAAAGLKAFYEVLGKNWDGAAQALSREMREFLAQVVEAIVQRNGELWPGGTSESSLSKRSATSSARSAAA